MIPSSLPRQLSRLMPAAATVLPREAGAVASRSEVGRAVNAAVRSATGQTVPRALELSEGAIEAIWVKSNETANNEVIDQVVAELAHARHELRIQMFAIHFDSLSCDRLLTAIARKQAANPAFKVYIVYGGELKFHLDPRTVLKSLPKALTAQDMKAALFRHGVKADVASYMRGPSRGALHSKSFLIDGRVGIVGGANITNTPSKDIMIKVKGPIIDTLLADFKDAWDRAKFWFHHDGSRSVALDHPALPKPTRGPITVPATSLVPMAFLSKQNASLFAGEVYANDADRGLLEAMRAARRQIRIQTPNCNDPAVWEAMGEAASRGVKVQLMLPKGFNQMRAIVDGANNDQFLHKFVAQLPQRARGNFELRWYVPEGGTFRDGNNHTKYVSVDGLWAYVGTQNMDKQSFRNSREIGLGIDDAATARRLDRIVFADDWRRGVVAEIPGQARSWWRRLVQRHLGF